MTFRIKSWLGLKWIIQSEVNGIKIKQVPELNDEFAKDAGEYGSLAEMREKLRAEIAST